MNNQLFINVGSRDVATSDHVWPYVSQGEELGMSNAPFAGINDLRDIDRSTTTRRRSRRAPLQSRSSTRYGQ